MGIDVLLELALPIVTLTIGGTALGLRIRRKAMPPGWGWLLPPLAVAVLTLLIVFADWIHAPTR